MFETKEEQKQEQQNHEEQEQEEEKKLLEDLDIKKTAISFVLILTGCVFIGAALQFGEFMAEFVTMGLFGVGGGAAALK